MTEVQLVVIGDWHLAFCTAVSFSHSGVKTLLKTRLAPEAVTASCPPCPVVEPGYDELRTEGSEKKTLFSSSSWSGWSARIWWLAIDTPVDDRDTPDTTVLGQALEEGLRIQSKKPEALAVSSQVPVGFCRELEKRFGIPVVYIPENLRLGKGIETFFQADRTVIGADSKSASETIRNLMSGFKTKFFMTDLASAEMVKHATNTFLAMSISYANEIARIGQRFQVDHEFVASALKADQRIGPFAYVRPGLGFAGGTLPRDLRVLQKVGRDLKVPTSLVDAVLQVNEDVDDIIIERLQDMDKSKSRQVALLGYSYKADTDAVRRSPAERLARRLRKLDYEVYGHDPLVAANALGSVGEVIRDVRPFSEIPKTCQNFILITPRPLFADLDWSARETASVLDLHGFFKQTPANVKVVRLWG